MLTMTPFLPISSHFLMARPLTTAGAVRFRAMTLSHLAPQLALNSINQFILSDIPHICRSISATASKRSIRPAELITKSIPPNIFSPSANTSSTRSSLVMSACSTSVHSGYAADTFSLKSDISSSLMSHTTTFVPARRKASAIALPRPPQPPVMRAVFWMNCCWFLVDDCAVSNQSSGRPVRL
jgi:hypothetical protein